MIFESSRLYVRPFTVDDFEDFFVLNNDPQVVRYIRDPKNREEAWVFLQEKISYYTAFPLVGSWAIVEKKSGLMAGTFMLRPSIKTEGTTELGYAFSQPYWGKGYATEIVKAGLEYAFLKLQLPAVVAITHPENVSSQKVLLKCGFAQPVNLEEDGRPVYLFSLKNPFIVETSRLLIISLTCDQLYLYLQAEGKLEKKLRLADTGRNISPDVKEVVTKFTLPNMQNARHDKYLFFTFWIVVEKDSRAIIAELGFKGPPGKSGDIEIGYGTMPDYRGKGYMTEALGGMIAWAKERSDVHHILAETDEKNAASIRVVRKNNFQSLYRKGKMLWWKVSCEQ